MFAVGNHCRVQQAAESDTMVGRLQLNQQFLKCQDEDTEGQAHNTCIAVYAAQCLFQLI